MLKLLMNYPYPCVFLKRRLICVGFGFVSIFLTPDIRANVIGATTQNFNTTSSATDYVTVHSPKTLGQGSFSLGLFLNNAVNTLPYFEGEDQSSRSKYNDSVFGSEVGLSYGVLKNLDLFLGVPAVLYQDVREKEESHGEFKQKGITDTRFGGKVRVWGSSLFGVAALASVNMPSTKDDPYAGEKSGPTYNTELIGEVNLLNNLDIAANAGYRWKTSGKGSDESPIEPFKNHIVSSIAAAYKISNTTAWVSELFSSTPTERVRDQSGRHTTTAEMVTGLKIFGQDNLVYQFGGGTELRHSVSSPDWRLYAGVYWSSKVKTDMFKASPRPLISQEVERKPDEVIVVRDIFFQFDSAQLAASDNFESLDALIRTLRKEPFDKLVIEGHTCSMGSHRYNFNLSQARAKKIRQLLIDNYGVAASKITAIGRGEIRPVVSNATEEGREANRRVEFKIYRSNDQLSSVNSKGRKE